MGRILAVDLGTKRVGLAVTDPLKIVASPLQTIPYRSRGQLADALLALARVQEVETVVIGLPIAMDGREGEGCRRSQNLARELEQRGIRTVLWDERRSTRRAEQALREMGTSRKRAPRRLDGIAAALILRDYLESAGG